MTFRALLLTCAMTAVAGMSAAGPQSYHLPHYDYSVLKTWNFVDTPRLPDDVLALNAVWSGLVHDDVAVALERHGFGRVAAEPDFRVMVSLRLRDAARGRQHHPTWPGGWPASGGWEVPASEATLLLSILEARSGTLVWRGVDARTIDIERPEHSFERTAKTLVDRFAADTKRRPNLTDR